MANLLILACIIASSSADRATPTVGAHNTADTNNSENAADSLEQGKQEESIAHQKTAAKAKDHRLAVEVTKHSAFVQQSNHTEQKAEQKVSSLEAQHPSILEFPRRSALMQQSNQTERETVMAQSRTRLQEPNNGSRKDQITTILNLVIQIVAVAVFSSVVASKYPTMAMPNDASKDIMQEKAVFRVKFGAICLQSFFVMPAMVGLLSDKTGMFSYWPAALVSVFCPCCSVLWLNNFSELNLKLGGDKEGSLGQGILEACLCCCCIVARNVEALDAATGSSIGCCSVKSGSPEAEDKVDNPQAAEKPQ